jgi:hypothetical protein
MPDAGVSYRKRGGLERSGVQEDQGVQCSVFGIQDLWVGIQGFSMKRRLECEMTKRKHYPEHGESSFLNAES